MGSGERNVKPLASRLLLWQALGMTKNNGTGREARLAEALRANLRRRKQKPGEVAAEPKPTANIADPPK